MSKVLTVGTFDMPHTGHLELFKKCRKLAGLINKEEFFQRDPAIINPLGEVIVGVNTDTFVYSFKSKYPVYPLSERIAIISSFKEVDQVIANDSSSLQNMLEQVNPDFLVVGSDWACKDYYKQIGVNSDWLEDRDITLLYVEYTAEISSTILRERLLSQ